MANECVQFVDLFAGIGGFRLVLESFKANCVFSSEVDKNARETYKLNFQEYPSGDITQIQAKDIPKFDILTAGFPCQPFSYAGKLEGFEDKTKGTLFFEVVRILKHHKPQMFLLENVKGLKSHNKGETLKIIVEQLRHIGYTIYWKILDSLDFGLPQQRQRWYCVGFLEPIHFVFPQGKKEITPLRTIINFDEDDEKLKLSEREKKRIRFHFERCPVDCVPQQRIEHDNSKYAPHTKKGKHGVFSYLKPDKTLRFHVGDYAKTQIQEAYYCTLDSYSPAIIKARAPKLWDLERHLSVLECQRLQGFPDQFKFGSKAREHLGNSISIPVVKAIVDQMLLYQRLKIPSGAGTFCTAQKEQKKWQMNSKPAMQLNAWHCVCTNRHSATDQHKLLNSNAHELCALQNATTESIGKIKEFLKWLTKDLHFSPSHAQSFTRMA